MVEQGVDTVVMEVSSHALDTRPRRRRAVRGRRIHQPVARPPRLPPDDGGLLRRQGAAVRPGVADARERFGGLRRRRRGPRDGRAAPHRGVTVSATGHAADWRVEDVVTVDRGAQEFIAVDPAGVHHRLRIGLPGRYNVANACWRWRCWTPSGCHRSRPRPGLRERDGAGPAGGGRPRPGRSWRWSTTRTSPVRCARCSRRCASSARAGWRWCSARAATATRASASRWAASPPSSPTWWWSPTTIPATRTRPRSAPRSWPARRGGAEREVVEIGDRREAIDHAVAWARAGDVVLIAGKGHEAGQTSHGQTRPFDDRDELADALEMTSGARTVIDLTARPDRRHRRRRAGRHHRRGGRSASASPAPSSSTRGR